GRPRRLYTLSRPNRDFASALSFLQLSSTPECGGEASGRNRFGKATRVRQSELSVRRLSTCSPPVPDNAFSRTFSHDCRMIESENFCCSLAFPCWPNSRALVSFFSNHVSFFAACLISPTSMRNPSSPSDMRSAGPYSHEYETTGVPASNDSATVYPQASLCEVNRSTPEAAISVNG